MLFCYQQSVLDVYSLHFERDHYFTLRKTQDFLNLAGLFSMSISNQTLYLVLNETNKTTSVTVHFNSPMSPCILKFCAKIMTLLGNVSSP